MAGRIRSLKPELLDDEPTAGLSDAAWRLFVSLWVVADDHGNTRLGSKYVAATIWQDTARDVDAPIDELVNKRFLEPYAKSDQRYAHIRGWEKHQRIDNAGNPRVPTPNQDDGSLPTWFRALRPILAILAASPPPAQVCLGGHKTSPEVSPLDHDHDHDHEGEPAATPPDPHTLPKDAPEPILTQPPPIPEPTTARPKNVTDDGQFGMAVSNWADGIRLVTGAPFPTPRNGSAELVRLLDAFAAHCVNKDRVAWAKETASAFAKAQAGTKLNAYSFADWLNSGRPVRGAKPTVPDTPNPYDGPSVRAERKRRDREYNAALENVVPAPIGELMAAIGVRKETRP